MYMSFVCMGVYMCVIMSHAHYEYTYHVCAYMSVYMCVIMRHAHVGLDTCAPKCTCVCVRVMYHHACNVPRRTNIQQFNSFFLVIDASTK